MKDVLILLNANFALSTFFLHTVRRTPGARELQRASFVSHAKLGVCMHAHRARGESWLSLGRCHCQCHTREPGHELAPVSLTWQCGPLQTVCGRQLRVSDGTLAVGLNVCDRTHLATGQSPAT